MNFKTIQKALLNCLAASLLVFLALVVLICWHYANRIPSGGDSLEFVEKSTQLAWALANDPPLVADFLGSDAIHHLPLPIFVSSVLQILSRHSPWSFPLTTLFFWTLALAALIVLGRGLLTKWWLALLPIAAVLSVRDIWEVGFSFNLEAGQLAAAAIFLAAFALDGSLSTRPRTVLVTLLCMVFSLNKATVLLSAVPAGLAFVAGAEQPVRRRRLILLFAILATAGLWIIPRLHFRAVGFAQYWTVPTRELPDSYYYARHLLIEYYGFPIFIALGLLMAFRIYRKDLQRTDLGFALFFLIPMLFLAMLQVQRAYFSLPAYLSLPAWYLYAANRGWEEKWVRRMSAVLVVFFVGFSLANATRVFRSVYFAPSTGSMVAGLRGPHPPEPTEEFLASFILDMLNEEPRARIAIDLSRSHYEFSRIRMLAVLKEPGLVWLDQVAVNDYTGDNEEEFIQFLDRATTVITVGHGWPDLVRPEQLSRLRLKTTMTELIERYESARGVFASERLIGMPDGKAATVFIRRDPDQDAWKGPPQSFEAHVEWAILQDPSRLIRYLKRADRLLVEGQLDQARLRYEIVLSVDPANAVASRGLAQCLPGRSLTGPHAEPEIAPLIDEESLSRLLRDPGQVRGGAKRLVEWSMALRREGMATQSLEMIERHGAMMAPCLVCREEFDLERARILLDLGRRTEARKVLRDIAVSASDKDLAQIAKDLLEAVR